MQHSTGTPTKADRERFRRIQQGGCIACRMAGLEFVPTQVHHLTVTGRHGGPRIGHHATVGLCPWHHQGIPPAGLEWRDALSLMGPSLARTPRKFREAFGFDLTLLNYQEQLLKLLPHG